MLRPDKQQGSVRRVVKKINFKEKATDKRTGRRGWLGAAFGLSAEPLETRMLLTGSQLVDYVNSAWAGDTTGQHVTVGTATKIFGTNAFATIQDGVNALTAGGTTNVLAGTYAENVTIGPNDFGISVIGPNTSYNPLSSAAPTNPQAVVEPGLNSNADTSSVFLVQASKVTIEGLTIQGSLTSGPSVGQSTGFSLPTGVTTYAAAGVSNVSDAGAGVSNDSSSATDIFGLTVTNNVVKDFKWVGVYGDTSDANASGQNTISNNYITDVSTSSPAYAGEGVVLYDDFYAVVTNNLITAVRTGVQATNFFQADPFDNEVPDAITGNQVEAFFRGIYDNNQYGDSTGFNVSNNAIAFDTADLPANYDSGITGANKYSNYNVGLLVQTIYGSTPATIQSNNVSGFIYGVEFWNDSATSPVTLSGGTLSNNSYGVYATNNDPRFGAAFEGGGAAVISGVIITNSSVAGVLVQDDLPNDLAVSLSIGGGTTISGSPIGAEATGSGASLSFASGANPASISLLGGVGNYIVLADNAMENETLDASQVSLGGFVGATTPVSDLASFYAMEAQITDGLDEGLAGLVSLSPKNVFLAASSEAVSAGSLERAVTVASSGDTVYVQAGTYVGDVAINQSLTLVGPNASLSGGDPTRVAEAGRGGGEFSELRHECRNRGRRRWGFDRRFRHHRRPSVRRGGHRGSQRHQRARSKLVQRPRCFEQYHYVH